MAEAEAAARTSFPARNFPAQIAIFPIGIELDSAQIVVFPNEIVLLPGVAMADLPGGAAMADLLGGGFAMAPHPRWPSSLPEVWEDGGDGQELRVRRRAASSGGEQERGWRPGEGWNGESRWRICWFTQLFS